MQKIEKRSYKTVNFWAIAILSVIVSHLPGFSWLFGPINIFTTAVHEMGHAIVCLATGGDVSGLTIVSDGAGHGGLTFCQGGNPFLYTQSGYLGAAVFGCFLIVLSQYPRIAKASLIVIGLAIGAASIFLVPGSLLRSGMLGQGLASMAWALAMGAGLVWLGVKLKASWANVLLLFLAVQTGLNSVTCIGDLLAVSLGTAGIQTSSDASSMGQMTGIPALIWSIFWGIASIAMLAFTLKETYGKKLWTKKISTK